MRFENREIRSMGRCSKWERFEVGEIRSREVKGSRSSNCSEGGIVSEYRSCRSHSLTNEIDKLLRSAELHSQGVGCPYKCKSTSEVGRKQYTSQERRATLPGCRVPVQEKVLSPFD